MKPTFIHRPPMPHKPRSHPETVRLEVNGVLDLHHFKPREVPELVREYLHECKRLGIDEVRIIHGKGKGVLRGIVQEILAADPGVRGFGPAHDGSGWGVTIAYLSADSAKRQTPSKPAEQAAAATTKRRWWRKLFTSSNRSS
jgi:DNA-nicking Smr family endonuclease